MGKMAPMQFLKERIMRAIEVGSKVIVEKKAEEKLKSTFMCPIQERIRDPQNTK